MLKMRGVGITNEVNRYGQKLELGGMFNAYQRNFNYGVPSFINHDHTKLFGWTYLGPLYFEPGRVYQTICTEASETENEYKLLCRKSIEFNNLKYKNNKEKFDELLALISPYIVGKIEFCFVNAVSIHNKDILLRVLPQLKSYCDDDGLIDINLLKPILPGVYQFDKFLVFAHQFFRRSFSITNTLNSAFIEKLESLRETGLNVRISLDQHMIGLASTEKEEFEFQYWWGPKFNDNLDKMQLGVTKHSNEKYDQIFSDILFTEMGFYEQKSDRVFECEEITDIPNINEDEQEFCGCRYVHSKIDSQTGQPYHLDGAIRAYSEEKMIKRLDLIINQTRRDTWYTKLWRTDGAIPVELWKELITHYYKDNMLVGEYFGGEDQRVDISLIEEDKTPCQDELVSKYIPSTLKKGDGLRMSLQFLPASEIRDEYDLFIRPIQSVMINGIVTKYIDTESITLYKLIKAEGITIRMPFVEKLAFNDLVHNFPLFLCKTKSIGELVLNSIYKLCSKWVENGNDRLISFSLLINYGNFRLLTSFACHINDFLSTFEKLDTSLPNEDSIRTWIEKFYRHNNVYKTIKGEPKLFSILTKNNVLLFKKRFIEKSKIKGYTSKKEALYADLLVPVEDMNAIKYNNISCTSVHTVKRSICSNCNKDYVNCGCIKFITPNVHERIEQGELLGVIWTNRKA